MGNLTVLAGLRKASEERREKRRALKGTISADGRRVGDSERAIWTLWREGRQKEGEAVEAGGLGTKAHGSVEEVHEEFQKGNG